jgi:metaxin
MTISRQLHKAAEAELLHHSSVIDVNDLYTEAEMAFEALSILLGDDEWFFATGNDEKGKGRAVGGPTIFDAEVFAYTHLLLDERMGWREKRLVEALRKWENLVMHRERVLSKYY